MAVDFASLVLGPCMAVFADPIVFTPKVSQPGVAAYPARGVFAEKVVRVDDGSGTGAYWSTLEATFGIMLADYPVVPKQNDTFVHKSVTWFVWDVNLDGQGGASLVAKQQRASPT